MVDEDPDDVHYFELPGADLSGEELSVTVIPQRADESPARAAFWCSTGTDAWLQFRPSGVRRWA